MSVHDLVKVFLKLRGGVWMWLKYQVILNLSSHHLTSVEPDTPITINGNNNRSTTNNWYYPCLLLMMLTISWAHQWAPLYLTCCNCTCVCTYSTCVCPYICMYIVHMYIHYVCVCAYIVLYMCTYSTCAFLHTLCMHMYMVYILYTDMNPQNWNLTASR